MTQIQENLCEDRNCDWYDGCGCCHPKFERFPFKPRKKKCKYYVEHDNREDDYESEMQTQLEMDEDEYNSETGSDNRDEWDD